MKRSTSLSDDQKKAIDKLEKLRVGALFMEPGTGKTLTALNIISTADTDWVLFIVPFQTKQNLQDELDKWGFDMPYRIEGVETLSNSDRVYLELLDELNKYKKPFIVVDESLKIKNASAKRTQRVFELGKKSYYRLVLNGTPISKNVMDLWAQMEFLSPKILSMSYDEYQNTFIDYIYHAETHHFEVRNQVNIDYLYSLVRPYVFDAKLNLDIDSVHERWDYEIENKNNYFEAKEELLSRDSVEQEDLFLAFTAKMQHSYAIDQGKVEAIDDILECEHHQPAIIFCKFVNAKEFFQDRYPNCKVLTYGKGTFGLNLQQYKLMIFADKTWDYAQLEQATRRIYRMGQTKDTKFYYLTGDVGLERLMDNCISNKVWVLNEFKKSSKKEQWLKDNL